MRRQCDREHEGAEELCPAMRTRRANMTIREITEKIEAYHPVLPDYDGCDGFKSGDPDRECTGIACALVPTVDVIRKTIELGDNLLYVHEPGYYMTPDFPEWRGGFPNSVYEEKRAMLEAHGIAVYRDHDHTHAHSPDGIFAGVIRYLGWEDYLTETSESLPYCYTFDLPETTAEDLNETLMEKIGMRGIRYIGRPDARLRRVMLVPHLYPGAFLEETEKDGVYSDFSTMLIRKMEEEGVQAIIPGEIIEWNLLSYIADASMLGRDTACFNIGHFNLEELGAKYARDWIGELIGHELPVHYVHTGELWNHQLKKKA